MGIRLPEAGDYGGRRSLNVNRMDTPGRASLEVVDEISAAANNFQKILDEKQGKKDQLSYAMLRNDLITADLNERQKLEQDRDWRTHVERYEEGFKLAAEEVYGKYPDINPHDRAIAQAEARLMVTKGRMDVSARANTFRVDEGYTGVLRQIDDAKKNMFKATDFNSRNAVIESIHETIDLAVDDGYFGLDGASKGEALKQKLSTELSISVLEEMEASMRIPIIERSLSQRRSYGTNVDGGYIQHIAGAAEMFDIPPGLIAAQAMMESGGDRFAKSGAAGDPTGIMQLGELAAEDVGVTDRTDEKQSIYGGTEYLRKMLDRFDGDPAKALAAYNLGPGKLMDIMDKAGEEWMAYIRRPEFDPKQETANYVDKLLPYFEGKENTAYLEATNSGQGPVSKEDIIASGKQPSVADLIPQDTLAVMLRQAKESDKANQTAIATQDAFSRITEKFPETDQKSLDARRKEAQDTLSGLVEERTLAKLTQEEANINNANVRDQRELDYNYARQMENDPTFSFEDIPQEDRDRMNPDTRANLKRLEASLANGRNGYAERSTLSATDANGKPIEGNSWDGFANMTLEEKKEENLETAAWKGVMTEEDHRRLKEWQTTLKNPDLTKDPVMEDKALYESLVSGGTATQAGFLPRTGRTQEQDETWHKNFSMFQDRVREAQVDKYKGGAVPYEHRKQILLEMMAEKAWVRDAGKVGIDGYWSRENTPADKPQLRFGLTSKQRNYSFIPIGEFSQDYTSYEVGEGDEKRTVSIRWPEWLRREANRLKPGYRPSQEDMENAMYAQFYNLGDKEFARRLLGGGVEGGENKTSRAMSTEPVIKSLPPEEQKSMDEWNSQMPSIPK